MVVGEIVRHIRFSERWLRRARTECDEGALARGVLTLSLAEAEIRRARELGAGAIARGEPVRAARVPHRQALPLAVGAVSLIVMLVVAAIAVPGVLPAVRLPSAAFRAPAGPDVPTAPVVTFDRPVGAILAMVQIPAVDASAPAGPAAAAIAVRPRTLPVSPGMARLPAPARVAGVPVPAPALPAVRAPAADLTARPPVPAVPRQELDPAVPGPAQDGLASTQARPGGEGGELIDLVLVAERTLRGPRF